MLSLLEFQASQNHTLQTIHAIEYDACYRRVLNRVRLERLHRKRIPPLSNDDLLGILRVLLSPIPSSTNQPPPLSRVRTYALWAQHLPHILSNPTLHPAAFLLFYEPEHTQRDDHIFETHWVTVHEYLDALQPNIPETLSTYVSYTLQSPNLTYRNQLHTWLCQQPGNWSHTHAHILRSQPRSKPTDLRALRALLKAPEHHPLLRDVLHELAHQNAPQRRLALFGYQRLKDTHALQTMIEREQGSTLRKELRKALREAQKPEPHNLTQRLGFYTLGSPIDPREDLSTLRALLLEKPSLQLWVRICNTLERLRIADAGDIGIQYARETLLTWPKKHRPHPEHWKTLPAFLDIAPSPLSPFWLPIATLAHPTEAHHVSYTLHALQGRARARLLTHHDAARLIPYVQHAWDWCAQHHVEPHHLRVRLDSGTALSNKASTWAETFQGFGVAFGRTRDSSPRQHLDKHGLRAMYIQLPSGHLARDALLMNSRTTNYEIPFPTPPQTSP